MIRWGNGYHRERRAVPRSKPGVGSRVLGWVVGMFILEALVAWLVLG